MADTHYFNVHIATELGIPAAVMLSHFMFWCEKNKANRKHEHDGLYWTYNSVSAFEELFPYLSRSSIKSAIKKLEDAGYLVSGNFNKSAYDRTKWYAVTDKAMENSLSIGQNPPMVRSESANQSAENSQSYISTGKDTGSNTVELPSGAQDDVADEVAEVVAYLNEVAGTSYRPTAKKTRELITARLREGYAVDDFRKVIDVKAAQWKNDPKWSGFLRPSTLFAPSHFDEYLNQSSSRRGRGVDLSIYD